MISCEAKARVKWITQDATLLYVNNVLSSQRMSLHEKTIYGMGHQFKLREQSTLVEFEVVD